MEKLNSLIQNLRTDYKISFLQEEEALPNPMMQCEKWVKQAVDAQVNEPNAFTLSTSSKDGHPSSRIVLLRGMDDHGLYFYTNYNSHKGILLIENPYTAVNFFWPELERQIRIEGVASKISATQSDEYFSTRPRESQISAWASDQSHVIENREILENCVKMFEEKFKNLPIPRPPHWGGFCIKPHYYEFWQGRTNRLHDRLAYKLEDNGNWLIERLSP